MSVAAVVPVYEAEPGLSALLEGLVAKFSPVVVVDDGSTKRVEADGVVLLRHETNRGKGAAIKTALRYLMERDEVTQVVFVDGDGQHRLEDVVKVSEKSTREDAAVFGVRKLLKPGVPFRSIWGNLWTALEVQILYGFRLTDTQTGLRAFPRRLFGALTEIRGERFEYEARQFALLKRRGEKLLTEPIETVYIESNRASHFRPFRDTLLTQYALFR